MTNRSSNTSFLANSSDGFDDLTALPNISSLWWLITVVTLIGLPFPLITLLRDSTSRNEFTCCVLNILIAEIFVVIYSVLFALETSYGPGILGRIVCPLVDSIFDIGILVIGWTELFITLRRAWSLFFPLHFRRHHARLSARVACYMSWMSALALIIPYSVRNLRISSIQGKGHSQVS